MNIRIKRIYDAPAPEDGTRVLVDRLWPRGVSKERAALDFWMKEIAPSPELRKWFNHDVEKWDEFQQRYRSELDANRENLEELKSLASPDHPLTLLYATRDDRHNSAAILRDVLLEQL